MRYNKGKYQLKTKVRYNKLLELCVVKRTVNEISLLTKNTKTNINNYLNALIVNNHIERIIDEKNGNERYYLALSKFVPDDQFAEPYVYKPRQANYEQPKWAGNPFRECIAA